MATSTKKGIIEGMEDFFKKAPNLPKGFIDWVVRYGHILAVVFGALGVLGAIQAYSAYSVISANPFYASVGYGTFAGKYYISLIAGGISSLLVLLSYSGLKARKLSGWNMLSWSVVVSVVGSVIAGQLVGALISFLIGFYVLFQLKPHYK